MSLIIPANSASAAGGYDVDNSCRFEFPSTTSMAKSSSSVANQKKFTISVWVKRSNNLTYSYSGFNNSMQIIGQTASSHCRLVFLSTGKLRFYGETSLDLATNRLFRDFSAWYHIFVAVDTTQGTASNRVKMYINGVQETSFATETYPSVNADIVFFVNSQNLVIGKSESSGGYDYLNAYLSELVCLEGTAAAPTDFGEFDDSGIWKPIEHDQSGNKGANGFFLDFKDSSNLGNDAYGGTDFTESNIAATDQSTDTPTNNFATLNPLSVSAAGTLTEGNTKILGNSGSASGNVNCTFAMTSGKWYFEAKVVGDQGSYPRLGAAPSELLGRLLNGNDGMSGQQTIGFQYESNGNKVVNTTGGSYGASFGADDIIGCALDLDNQNVYYYKNGAIQNSGTALASGATHFGTGKHTMISAAVYPSGQGFSFNFGNPSFSISSGNADGNGYGNFEYAVPSGYYSLNTKNLAEYG